ncbi:hypothetical protein Rs2_11347 [Raphanus sativus]|uniref:Uncharacterized protein LOC108844582 n=1 Tax=Raphanus sativus TaxID=3726 RepID=A0A6J0MPD3_RAPSA|nr:uncharacterized protein LOC108844582 [Raphanus sativus]KAJ4907689.1 hypothetical protein Rs2_11347 [Raphanus sativus]
MGKIVNVQSHSLFPRQQQTKPDPISQAITDSVVNKEVEDTRTLVDQCCFLGLSMDSHCSLSGLLLLAFCLLCFFTGDSSATRPGVFYTRHRGRCTPQYWSSRREAWPRMVPERSTVERMFGVMVAKERWRSDLTLVESTARNDEEGNAYGALLKQGTAALLNSYARRSFSYAPWEVKTMLIQAMISEPAARRQAQKFKAANVACD